MQLGRERALGSARPLRPKGGHHNRQWNPLASPARKSQLAQRDPVGSDGRTDGGTAGLREKCSQQAGLGWWWRGLKRRERRRRREKEEEEEEEAIAKE